MRPTPYDAVFGQLGAERFPALRDSLLARGTDPHDLDAFVLDREVVLLLRHIVPEGGVGEAVEQHVLFLHHAFLYWLEGSHTFGLQHESARALLAGRPDPVAQVELPRAFYVQFPERLVWATLTGGGPAEPLDGMFVRPWPDGGLFVLAVFGFHPSRGGFSVLAADGYPAAELEREDGTALFAPVLPGGAAAGLHSITSEAELLELAARTFPLAARAVHEPGTPDSNGSTL